MNKIVLSCILLLALGCSGVTDIRAITRSPLDYRDRQVTIRGIVRDPIQVPFSDHRLFRLEDDTGEIWVLGKSANRNETRAVRGSVKPGITVGTRTFGVLFVEEDATEQGASRPNREGEAP